MQPLNSSQLAAFVEIVRTGSFEGAAKRLHVTPSAISQRVKQLEDSLGQILIVRQSPCRATKAGNELLRHAIQVMLLEEELAGRMGIEDGRSSQPITLSVAVNADSLDGWFVGAVRETCTNLRILLDIRVEDGEYGCECAARMHGKLPGAHAVPGTVVARFLRAAFRQRGRRTFVGGCAYTRLQRERQYAAGVH
jgi:LysR family transcriptional regulator (chromosome initiation inhibitor)